MGSKTKIEWAEATWNPLVGCSAISAGCKNCYAAGVASRFSKSSNHYEGLAKNINGHAEWTGLIRFNDHLLWKPREWRRPRRIFVGSMTDIFHKEVTESALDAIFEVMMDVTRHEYLILTKRPRRMLEYLESSTIWNNSEPIDRAHLWFGVSVENQRAADERMPLLLKAPVVRRFVSAEPLLGSVILPFHGMGCSACHIPMPSDAKSYCPMCMNGTFGRQRMIDLVIAGGESGCHARPMHPRWVVELQDQCDVHEVPFFFKQWGEWAPSHTVEHLASKQNAAVTLSGEVLTSEENVKLMPHGVAYMSKVGKKHSGAELNGKIYQQFPKPLIGVRMFDG